MVTGSSRGIGRAIAERLAESGAAVGVTYFKSEAASRELEATILARGGRVWVGACDVGDEQSVEAYVRGVSEALGPIDILVNNAGVVRDANVVLMSKARWDEVINVNLNGTYHAVRAVVRGMLARRWGRIINVSSPSARMPLGGQTAYAASKAGLEGFTRALSRDLAAKGVLVNAVAPGLIETDLLEAIAALGAGEVPEGGTCGQTWHASVKSLRLSRSWPRTPPAMSLDRLSASTAGYFD